MLADRYEGKRLNSPNDVVVRSDGAIYFTDPRYGIDSDYEGHRAESELGGCYVFRVDPHRRLRDRRRRLRPPQRPRVLASTSGCSTSPTRGAPRTCACSTSPTTATLSSGREFATCTVGGFDGFRLDDAGPDLDERRRRRALSTTPTAR